MFTTEMRTDDFRIIRWCLGYTDKSLFLEDILLHQDRLAYVTAPARFGKSTLLSMMEAFFGAEYVTIDGQLKEVNPMETDAFKIFKDLNIFKAEKKWFVDRHFKKYIIVRIDFKRLMGCINSDFFKKALCETIIKMVQQYSHLVELTNIPEDLKNFIRTYHAGNLKFCSDNLDKSAFSCEAAGEFISLLNGALKKPVIILGDEFDAFLHGYIFQNIQWQDDPYMRFLLQTFLGSMGKNKEIPPNVIAKLYFTGTLNLGGLMSALCNTIDHKDFFHDEHTAKFYGLTSQEVHSLLSNFSMTAQYKEVEDWFDGFAVLNSSLRLFSIPTVVNYVKTKGTESYILPHMSNKELWLWFDLIFSDYRVASRVLKSIHFNEPFQIDSIKGVHFRDILKLKEAVIQGHSKTCFLSPHQVDIFFTFLIETGLYTVISDDKSTRWIRPTNKEAKETLTRHMKDSGYTTKRSNAAEKLEIDLRDSVRSIDANPTSIERFCNATYELFQNLPPKSEADYRSVIISNFRAVAMEEPASYLFNAEIVMEMTEEGKQEAKTKKETKKTKKETEEEEKDSGIGKIDFIFVNLRLGFVIIFEFKYERGGGAALNQLFLKRYFDILKTHRDYQNVNIKSSVFLGMSLTHTGTLSIKYVPNSFDKSLALTYRLTSKISRKINKQMRTTPK